MRVARCCDDRGQGSRAKIAASDAVNRLHGWFDLVHNSPTRVMAFVLQVVASTPGASL